MTDPRRASRFDLLELIGVFAAFFWVMGCAWQLPVRDVPLGIDWQRYLGNALAIAQDDWAAYQLWRGPLHPFVCLLLTPLAGHLLEASQLASALGVGALVLASAALGRRMLGPMGGFWTALLLAGWPDLALLGRMSTPYPMLAGLVAAGIYALDLAFLARVRPPTRVGARLSPRWMAAGAAGVLFGLAGATDARGLVLAAGASVGVMLVGASPPWGAGGDAGPTGVARAAAKHVLALLGVLALAWLTRELIVGRLPVQLLTLGEQVALQRDLHAREAGIRACVDKRAAAVVVSDLWSACGRETAWRNLGRLAGAMPFPWWVGAALGALGLRRRLLPAFCLCLTLLPAAFVVGMEHRYILPLSGALSILLVSGAFRLADGAFRLADGVVPLAGGRARLCAAGVLTLALALGWRMRAATLLDRATGVRRQPSGHAQAVRIDALPPIAMARRVLRERAVPGPSGALRVVDCAGLSLDERLYPQPVEEAAFNGRSSARCKRLLSGPASPNVWVLARGEADASWVVEAVAGADLRVLRGPTP